MKQCKTAIQGTMLVPVSLSEVLEKENLCSAKNATDLKECVAIEHNRADT